MTSHVLPRRLAVFVRRPRASWALVFAGLLLTTCWSVAPAAEAALTEFNLPADVAGNSLKKFSSQSGTEVNLAASALGRVRTNEVRGRYAPREALDLLIAGTGLVVEQNAGTGVLTIARNPFALTSTASRALPIADETIVMSPFEVDASNQRGYYAANTMSGTRLNTKIEDLASAITVVTKEQMADFAMIDINDIFNYEASTEGAGNYTDFEVNSSGVAIDNTMVDPANANRIRGIGRANISDGNFETSGRVPVDPVGIDGVEISRGPNSTIFGLGNPSGTVNMMPSSANLSRDKAQVQFRADSYDGYRASLDVNRVVRRGSLAVRGSAVFQHDGYVRKPSGTDTTRLNGMVKFQPFKSTTMSASYSHYRLEGTRANTSMPRDAIEFWRSVGSPTWDPLTQTRYINGQPVQVGGTLDASSGLSSLVQGSGRGESHLHIDGNGSIGFWTPGRGTTADTPGTQNQTAFFYTQSTRDALRSTQQLFNTDPPLHGKDIYDWSEINLAAMNSQTERTRTSKVQVEQFFLNTPAHTLAAQLGWFREDSRNKNRYFYGKPHDSGRANYLHVNTNIRLLTGAPNPYFLRPYISLNESQEDDLPMLRDTYRGQLAYKLDLAAKKNWLRWLGMHQFSGYAEYRDFKDRSFLYRDAIVSTHPWAPAGADRGTGPAPAIYQNYYQFYVGDGRGNNVDYGPADYKRGVYDYTWGNALTGQKVERVELGSAPINPGGEGRRRLQKTQGGVIQSHLMKGRLVTTFGLRNDENFNQSLTGNNDWNFNEGRTKTAGVVLKPFSWLHVHANTSDSFLPSTLAQNLQGQIVPDPTARGEDYGFTLNLFSRKLIIRANQYDTKQINSRKGASTTLAGILRVFDVFRAGSQGYGLDYHARNWITNTFRRNGTEPTAAQIDTRLAEVMHLSPERLQMLQRALPSGGDTGLSELPLAEPSDLIAKGKEIEINYNPTDHWTMKLNLTEQHTIDGKLAPSIDAFLAERMPVWTRIVDEDRGTLWWTGQGYATNTSTPQSYFDLIVARRLPIIKALEGKSRPQVRRYRANFSQSFRLAGITDHRILKRFNVGGAARWEDKGAIGYYGVQRLPEVITDLDPNRPVWDKTHLYVDLFAGYRTKLFSDRIGANIQLNVRNVQEGGRLQAIAAFPDGSASGLRIIDPRQFILTVTFDL